jgi:hypothetical protein
MHYIAEYGFAAHWRYKEKLSREDLWLDRLVQWKKWVAAEKLRLRDAKVREGGSLQRDVAIAALIEAAAAAASAAASPAVGSPAAVAAAYAAPPSEQQQHHQQQGSPASGGSPAAAAAELDARFMARFSIQPVSDEDLEAHAAQVLISGPRGVRVEGVPARCTLAQLLASGAVAAAESRGCSLRLNGEPVPLLARREVVLRPGDHLAFVEEPCLVPSRAGGRVAAPAAPAAAPSLVVGADSDDLPPLTVFMPGQSTPMEVSLGRRLAASSSRLRQAALAM